MSPVKLSGLKNTEYHIGVLSSSRKLTGLTFELSKFYCPLCLDYQKATPGMFCNENLRWPWAQKVSLKSRKRLVY